MELAIYMQPKKDEINLFKKIKDSILINFPKAIFMEREKIDFKLCKDSCKDDIIFVIGGDGTFLRASHFVDDQLVYGINLNPKKKEGFFMDANPENIDSKLKKIKNKDFKTINLNRLKGELKNKIIPNALNEYYIGHKTPYGLSHYNLEVNNESHDQKSSGLLISTASGSHAWIHSAGGQNQDIESNKIQFLVREPYVGRLNKISNYKGFTNRIKVTSKSNDLIIVADSLSEEIPFKKGDEFEITSSKKSLRTIKVN